MGKEVDLKEYDGADPRDPSGKRDKPIELARETKEFHLASEVRLSAFVLEDRIKGGMESLGKTVGEDVGQILARDLMGFRSRFLQTMAEEKRSGNGGLQVEVLITFIDDGM